MPPSTRTKLEPWIENLILGYDDTKAEQKTKSRRLKAHVVGCAPMALSQAQGAQGPTDLLFLSDGVVQMPAILTASAWDDLQEREDRECFSSLVDTTVSVQAYSLQFYMNPEQTRCRFFVAVSKLATIAAGPPKDMPPSCTTLAPVRQQICKTWSSLLPQGPSAYSQIQGTQCGFDLSDLLGAWQDDALDSVLEGVEDGLRMAPPGPVSLQPSTSSCNPPRSHLPNPVSLQPSTSSSNPHSYLANAYTGWDADRIRFKSVEQFSIPVCHLLMPEEEAQRPQAALEQGSERQSGILNPPVPPENEILERGSPGSDDTLSRDGILNEDTITELNPWDAYTPPFAILSTSDESSQSIISEAIPPKDLIDTAGITIQVEGVPLAASTQMSSKGPSEISQTSEQSKTSIPPYQKPQSTPPLLPLSNSSASGSTEEPIGGGLMFTRIKNCCSPLLVSDEETLQVAEEKETQEEVALRKRRAVKKKKNHCSSGTQLAAEEEGVHSSGTGSPPSWLFETQRASRAKARISLKPTKPMGTAEARSSLKQTEPMGTVSGVHSTVHSDGTPFSYAYKPPADQLLQDLSKFKVSDEMLSWAVKYLTVPNQTDKADNSVSEQ